MLAQSGQPKKRLSKKTRLTNVVVGDGLIGGDVMERDNGRPHMAHSSDHTWIMSHCDLDWSLRIRRL